MVVVAPELAGKPLQQISRLSDRHGRPVNPGTFDLADGARIVGLDGHGALDTAFLPLEMQNADVIRVQMTTSLVSRNQSKERCL